MLKKLLVSAVLVTVFAVAPQTATADESATYYTEMIGIPCFGCTWYPYCNCQINPPIIIH